MSRFQALKASQLKKCESSLPASITPLISPKTHSPSDVLLGDLCKEVHDLLKQYMPNETSLDVLVDLYSNIVGTPEPGILKQFITVLLQNRELLVEALSTRAFKYQRSIKPLLQIDIQPSLQPTARQSSAKPSATGPSVQVSEPAVGNLKIDVAERAFFSATGSTGTFRYFTTSSTGDIEKPLVFIPGPKSGDIFIHMNTSSIPQKRQVWLFVKDKWDNITEEWMKDRMIIHPEFSDRVLTVRTNQTPNWILRTSAEQKAQQKAKLQKQK
ncbi:hypothetical protein C8J57DRAFT_1260129 [Mycena rebaudengoi]|nr:hypothetical protein C8J57DRAFT_1260129 [Mycena rebaudengoi]